MQLDNSHNIKGGVVLVDEKTLLVQIEQLSHLMKQVELWSSQPPAHHKLESQFPFCADTLAFEEWLQFVFIPKITQVIEHKLTLPHAPQIANMAEQVFQERQAEVSQVIEQLKRLDRFLVHWVDQEKP